MKTPFLTATLLLTLTAGPALAQPAGGIGTSTGPSGGVVGAGTINSAPPGSGIISGSGTSGSSGISTPASPSTLPGSNENLGAMPAVPNETTTSTPNQSPSGSAPAAAPP
jgi:hypothetical protein